MPRYEGAPVKRFFDAEKGKGRPGATSAQTDNNPLVENDPELSKLDKRLRETAPKAEPDPVFKAKLQKQLLEQQKEQQGQS